MQDGQKKERREKKKKEQYYEQDICSTHTHSVCHTAV